ncbi:MAG: AAA family ATPase [Gemmatimonadota bacterium]|nr:AAA family ATPase [Gemmatimonadota bacterium]
MPNDALHDLELLLRSRHGLIYLDTAETVRAGTLLQHVADRLSLPFFRWTRSNGIQREGRSEGVYDTRDPAKALRHVSAAGLEAVYHFEALAPNLDGQALLVALARDAARSLERLDGGIVLTGDGLVLPPPLREVAAHVTLPGPSDEELAALLAEITRDLSRVQHVEVTLSAAERTALVRHLSGLTLMEAEKVLTKAIVEDGALTSGDIGHVLEAKRRIIEREGLLEYYPTEHAWADIADLAGLKSWLSKRAAVVRDPDRAREFGLAFPKGILLLGVPGCGKSLSAKAVASEWGLPLLKLDPSNLYNKYIGESERNFKRAVQAAERMAPVVLWIDELEKAFASGGSEDGGVAQRVLGSFLSWMQDRSGNVFVVATANDIGRVPPELLRKGRFDEIFFVDLPGAPVRQEIFRVHLEQRDRNPDAIDLEALAARTEGFSGSEIEEVVVSGLYTAFAEGTVLDTATLAREAAATRPLAVTMRERIDRLRTWAEDRAARAN